MTQEELDERDQLILDIKEHFNAKPMAYNYQKTLVLCSEIKSSQWILVNLETADGKKVSDEEATRLNRAWMTQAINATF